MSKRGCPCEFDSVFKKSQTLNQIQFNDAKRGFTLAEILVTLAVIGVVAAITIPALVANIQDSKWTSLRERAVYNIRSAARSISANNSGLNGFGSSIQFRDELAKYMPVTKLCDTTNGCFHTADNSIKDIAGNILPTVPSNGAGIFWSSPGLTITPPADAAAGMMITNGTSMSILYNPNCKDTDNNVGGTKFSQNYVCANIVFDTNGLAQPNQLGKDIGFATVINPSSASTVVTGIIPDDKDNTGGGWASAQSTCMGKGNQWHLPTKEELSSLYYNSHFVGNINGFGYWSSIETSPGSNYAWYVSFNSAGIGMISSYMKNQGQGIRCVKR